MMMVMVAIVNVVMMVMTMVMVVVMVITCRAMMGAVTCLSNGNLWKSIGQSMSKLMREEYLWF